MTNYQLGPEPLRTKGDIVAGDPGQRGRDRVLLGRLVEAGPRRNLYLDITGEQVIAVIGKRGTGKSYTLGVIVEGLAAGEGESQIATLITRRAGLVLDIMDIFWTSRIPLSDSGSPEIVRQYDLMHQKGYEAQDLAIDIWIPNGFQNDQIDPEGFHALSITPSDLELDDWAALFDVDIFTEPRGMLIADVIAHVGRDGYTRQDGTNIPPNLNFSFAEILDCLESDHDFENNYRPDTIRSIRQRMSSYAALPLFSENGTPLTDLLRPFRVSVLMMARVPDALKQVIVATLLRRIMRARRDASFAQKRLDLDPSLVESERVELLEFVQSNVPRTWVCLDEAHVLAGTSERTIAREALVKFAKEGRNYGLSLAVATQQPSALDSRLLSQTETLIAHQLTSPADASIAHKAMRSPAPETVKIDGENSTSEMLLRRLGQGEAAFSCGNAPHLQRMCVVGIRPRVTAHGGYEA